MPELPEVTTMVNGLRNKVLKRTVTDVWTDFKKNIKKPSIFSQFKAGIVGTKIEKIKRKGKLVLFYLSNNKVLIVHPKMSGHFLYGKWQKSKQGWEPATDGPMTDPMNKHIHLILFLDNDKMLAFTDLRKFARIELWDKKEIAKAQILSEIGPDALAIDRLQFQEIIKKAGSRKIKQVLMDQKLMAGIGNIYSDEILFKAGVNPFRTADGLKQKEIEAIFQAIRLVLKKAIDLAGTSISNFRRTDGSKGSFQKVTKVYRREGEKCLKCGTPIKRQKIGGRSAHFCPKCQK